MTRAGRPTAGTLAAAAILTTLLAAAPPPLSAAPPRDSGETLTGPLSDFWARVKRDWSRRLTGLNRGPLQTAIWVALVWDGPDDLPIAALADGLQERESRRWVRAQITKHRWEKTARRDLEKMQALRHNIIVLGTPGDNALVARALESTPLTVERDAVSTGRARFTGNDLLVVAIAPNPISPRQYALVITGTSSEALLQADQVAYGETDYVVLRGRKILERGFYAWRDGLPARDQTTRAQTFTEHFNWRVRKTDHFRIHYDPVATTEADALAAGRRMDRDLESSAAFLGIATRSIRPIECYLYASLDEKVTQTSDARPAHLSAASNALHLIHQPRGGSSAIDGPLAARAMIRTASGVWGEDGERELPGLADALALAARETFESIPLPLWAARSTRDAGYHTMDYLLARRRADIGAEATFELDAAAFVRTLALEEGIDRIARFYRTARRADFHSRFREIFGRSIKEAEAAWLASLPASPLSPRRAGRPAGYARDGTVPQEPDSLIRARDALARRDHGTLERLLGEAPDDPAADTLRARLFFRTGRFEEAVAAASRALTADPGVADRAWARLTLGRAQAMLGRPASATRELNESDLREGPEVVRVVADYWLETLGLPLNRMAANRILMQQADADLMNFSWEEAEEKLKSLLASDPANRDAHALLGQVYLSKYQYWYDWSLLDLELFPGFSMADPETFKFLADKGRRELRIAESLPFGQPERWMSETGPVEPGEDQAAPHFLLGKVHFLKEEMEAARREFETALSLEGNRTPLAAYCRLYLGRIAAATGDDRTAREQFEAVVRMGVSSQVTGLAREALSRLEAASATP